MLTNEVLTTNGNSFFSTSFQIDHYEGSNTSSPIMHDVTVRKITSDRVGDFFFFFKE